MQKINFQNTGVCDKGNYASWNNEFGTDVFMRSLLAHNV